jgi:peptidylprolyl isomerase
VTSIRLRLVLILAGAAVAVLLVAAVAVAVFALRGNGTLSWSAMPEPSAGLPATRPSVGAGTGPLTELRVTTLVEGTGEPVRVGQTITCHYVGVFYATGEEFDSSWSRGQPASFEIGTGQVIAGWDQGLVGVRVGSRVQLDIPADLAYGDAGNGRPAGPLRFVVDVLSAR